MGAGDGESIGVEEARRDGTRWEFFRTDHGWWFGPRPAGTPAIDLFHHRVDELDNLQVLCATGFLQRCGRNGDAAQLFATQTGCSLAEARAFCDDGEVSPDAVFSAPPWPLTKLAAAQAAAAERVRQGKKGLIAYAVGALVALALVAIVFILI